MTRSLFFVSVLALGVAFGCGSLSNNDSSLAKVQGTLQGNVPASSRVALVWRQPTGGFLVSHEADVVGGSFSFDLTSPPADSLFFQPEDPGGGSDQPPDQPVPEPGQSSSGAGGGTKGASLAPKLGLRDTVSGTVSGPMSVAVAGFVLYRDQNGNGKLDLTSDTADSPDEILGGSDELMLTYLRDGSSLDLEKLRDRAGQLPSRGYNLVWLAKDRWLPLVSVDLTLGETRLPDAVCYAHSVVKSDDGNIGSDTVEAPPPAPTEPDPGSSSSGGSGSSGSSPPPGQPYPSPDDPNLHCGPDGRSFSYSNCPPPPPPKTGLCRGFEPPGMPCTGWGVAIPYDQPIPEGWPCPVDGADGGPWPDGGTDASTDGGWIDGGPAPDAGL
jgi:hypothetical protein